MRGLVPTRASITLLLFATAIVVVEHGEASELYVMANPISEVRHHEAIIESSTKQCHIITGSPLDHPCFTYGPNSFNSEVQNLSPFVGVAVNTTGDRFHVPVQCQNDVNLPNVGASSRLVMDVSSGFVEDTIEVCDTAWAEAAVDAPSFTDEAVLTASCFHCTGLGRISARTLMFTPLEDQEHSDRLYWFVLVVAGMALDTVGTLTDAAADDGYLQIAEDASKYVIDDPSGDDVLRNAAGTVQVVTDGAAVRLGDLDLVRAPNGPVAKTWTITHQAGRGFAGELRDEGPDNVFHFSTVG